MPEQDSPTPNARQLAVSATATTNPPVTTLHHPVGWGASYDLDVTLGQRVMALAPLIAIGCWYLNARFTVWSHSTSATFFAEVRRAQASWLRTARQVLSNYGHRHQARQAELQARRAAFHELGPGSSAGRPPHAPPEVVPLSTLPADQRREVREAGRLAKQMAFSGVLFIDGDLVKPATWNRLADDLLNPDGSRIDVSRRRIDLSALKASGDTSALEQVAREAIRHHLDTAPAHAAFITPRATISAPTPNEAFYLKADKHKVEWCCLLKRTIGNGDHRRARRADLRALTLALSGTLIVDGQFYLPGCWPNQEPTLCQLRQTPFNSPTVPPDFLGLDHPSSG